MQEIDAFSLMYHMVMNLKMANSGFVIICFTARSMFLSLSIIKDIIAITIH